MGRLSVPWTLEMRGALLLAAHCAASAAYVPAPGGHVGTARFGEAAHVAACPARNAAPLGGLRCEMTKLETSAVQRMTKDFGKLCKNCPTLLQPRVDTLTEMIMGLPAAEREELLATVAQRVEAAGAEADGVRTPRETYDFQRTGVAGAGAGISPEPSPIPGALPAAPTGSMKKTNDDDKMQRKLMDKVDKYTGKLAKNEMKLQRAVRMLAVADKLIAAPDSERITTPLPEAAIDAMDKEIPMVGRVGLPVNIVFCVVPRRWHTL